MIVIFLNKFSYFILVYIKFSYLWRLGCQMDFKLAHFAYKLKRNGNDSCNLSTKLFSKSCQLSSEIINSNKILLLVIPVTPRVKEFTRFIEKYLLVTVERRVSDRPKLTRPHIYKFFLIIKFLVSTSTIRTTLQISC